MTKNLIYEARAELEAGLRYNDSMPIDKIDLEHIKAALVLLKAAIDGFKSEDEIQRTLARIEDKVETLRNKIGNRK